MLGAVSLLVAALFQPLPRTAPAAPGNPQSPAKVELGKQLFFDPRLSLTGTVSCNSCHDLAGGGEDGLKASTGVHGQTGKRSAPTVWNSGLLSVLFWDGRAASLEDQAKGPMINPVEMGMASHDLVVARLREVPGYVDAFAKVFGGTNSVTIDHAAMAVAAFERTLMTPDSPFDRFLKGDQAALSTAAKAGFKLVQDVGCTACHQGVAFAGPALPAGTGFYQKFPTFTDNDYVAKYHLEDDLGRYETTHVEADKHFWRVPTWRNIALTAPYFHNGSVPTLAEAVRVMAKTQLNRTLGDGEVQNIVAFLSSLTGTFPSLTLPRLPPTPGRSLVNDADGSAH